MHTRQHDNRFRRATQRRLDVLVDDRMRAEQGPGILQRAPAPPPAEALAALPREPLLKVVSDFVEEFDGRCTKTC